MNNSNNKTENRYSKLLLIETAGLSIVLLIFLIILIWVLLNEYSLGNIMNNFLNFLASLGSIAGGCAALYVFYSIPKWKKDYDNKLFREKLYKALANIDALEELVQLQVDARKYYYNYKINFNIDDDNTKKYGIQMNKWEREISYLFNLTRDRLLILSEYSYYFSHIKNNEIKGNLDLLSRHIKMIHNMPRDTDMGIDVSAIHIDKENKEHILDTEIFKKTKDCLKIQLENS